MYWLLSFLIIAIHQILKVSNAIRFFYNINDATGISVYFLWTCAVIPIYLLIVNYLYIKWGKITYKESFWIMFIVIWVRIAADYMIPIIQSLIENGAISADSEGILVTKIILLSETLIPLAIICIGLVIYYFVKNR